MSLYTMRQVPPVLSTGKALRSPRSGESQKERAEDTPVVLFLSNQQAGFASWRDRYSQDARFSCLPHQERHDEQVAAARHETELVGKTGLQRRAFPIVGDPRQAWTQCVQSPCC